MSIFEGARLPQNETKPNERQARLAEFQEKFRFDQTVIRNVPISATVPEEAKPGPGWALAIVATAYKLRRNWEKLLAKFGYAFEQPLGEKSVQELAGMLLNKDLQGILGYCDPDLGVALTQKRPESFTEYYQLFQHLEMPEGADQILSDTDFADYFVAGLNPMVIRRLDAIPENLAFDQDFFSAHAAFANDSLNAALAEGRLFIADYRILSTLEPGVHPDQKKYIYAPIAVLGLPRDSGNLEVLGIQVGQDRNRYPMLSPRSGKWDWLVAKTLVKTSDINYHEVSSHLGLTHLVIDPIVVATWRQLSTAHPLHQLLVPHFEGTIPINALAVRRLINVDGKVEQLLSPELASDYRVIEIIRNSFQFRQSFLKTDLTKRGVDTSSRLGNYPYRDDAILIWDAIEAWVSDYVRAFYGSDQDVQLDTELARWTADIIDPNGGRIRNFAPDDAISDRKTLIETLTMIIFTASAQHAAVNFPQGRAAAVPYQPMTGYAPAPTQPGLSEADAIGFLPPLDRAIKQTHTLSLLGDTYYTQLGKYALGTFGDKRIVPQLLQFQIRLLRIEGEIDQRNRKRRTSYPYLKPSKIPQSINI